LSTLRIAEAARKHGIEDDDILHAVRMAIAEWELEDGLTMLVGPARDGGLLEVGVLDIDGDDPVTIHAMRARPRYLPHRR
jgi:hypothetical protein